MKLVEEIVISFNRLNEKNDYFIETMEREELAIERNNLKAVTWQVNKAIKMIIDPTHNAWSLLSFLLKSSN